MPPRPGQKSERRVSETDPEARIIKHGDGGCAPSHNVQISTDAEHGVIVGVGVTQSPVDWGQLMPELEEIKHQAGRLPEQVVVDGGFTTRKAVLATAELGVDLIGGTIEGGAKEIARRLEQRTIDPAFRAENFRYDTETNAYSCPDGKILRQHAVRDDRIGIMRHLYRARAADCRLFVPQAVLSWGKYSHHRSQGIRPGDRRIRRQDADGGCAEDLSVARRSCRIPQCLAKDQNWIAAVLPPRTEEGSL